jgi:TonB family protein
MADWLRTTRVLLTALLILLAQTSHAQAPSEIVEPQLLERVPPLYPAKLAGQDKVGVVVVELDVDVQGKVARVQIVESAGADFDKAAVDAGKKLVFSPALAAGKPVPVRIRFRFEIAPEVNLDRREASPSLGKYDRRDLELAPAGFASLEGRLIERGTGKAVSGTLVTVPDQKAETISDGTGYFRFGLLSPGKHQLYVPGTEHKPVRQEVTIADGKTLRVDLRVERLSYTLYRATAEAPPEPGEMARRSLTVEEIQKLPGTNGDAFKVVQNMPGVSRASAGSGQIIVRGSAPGDTIISVEGVKIPILYHFGGIYSIINTDILDGIDFYPGGYAVKYGRQTGGVLNARLQVPKEGDKWNGYVESNVFHTGFLLRGPIGENTNIAVAGRRSYIDLLLPLFIPEGTLPFTVAPRYYDYQLKLDHRFSKHTEMTWFGFGTDDTLSAVLKTPPAAFPQARGGLETSTNFGALMGILRHRGNGWTSTTTIAGLLSGVNASFGDLFRFDLLSREYTLRQDFTVGDGPVSWRAGLDVLCNPFSIQVYAPPLRGTGERGTGSSSQAADNRQVFTDITGWFVSPAVWFDTVLKLHPRLEVVPGVRLDFYRGDAKGESLLPRLNVRYKLNDAWTLKASTGQISQRADPQYLSSSFGNPNLLPFRSFETAAGFEWHVGDWFDLDVQAFKKLLSGVIVPAQGLFPAPPYTNQGNGDITGMEVLLRRKPGSQFFGWISYTLQKATRVDHPGDPERLFGWDQTHILTALGTYKLPLNFEVGVRFRLVTGNPTTANASAVYNEQTDTYQRVASACQLCSRLPTFHQLDVRVDKKFIFDSWMLNVYLDVQNAYNQGNPEGVQYNYDATLAQYATGLPIIPSFGIRGEF